MPMNVRACAFDLDGTLLRSDKTISPANRRALEQMHAKGVQVIFASGRLGSSMMQYASEFAFEIGMLTLNGAAVYEGSSAGTGPVYERPLQSGYADSLISFAAGQDFAINYYVHDNLYSVSHAGSREWIELYHQQTRTRYHLVESLDIFRGSTPSKVIFVGAPQKLDELEKHFHATWDSRVYICRTWDHYLEFLDLDADKGKALQALADHYAIPMQQVAAFGDAENDIPMLSVAGMGFAMANASHAVKACARQVLPWTNDQDAIAGAWHHILHTAG